MTHKTEPVNQNLPELPDNSLFFNPHKLNTFDPEKNTILTDLYESFFTLKEQQNFNRWILFSNLIFKLQKSHQNDLSLRVSLNDKNQYCKILRQIVKRLQEKELIIMRKGYFNRSKNPDHKNSQTRILLKEALSTPLVAELPAYPFIFKIAYFVNNKRHWKVDVKKSRNPPRYIKKSEQLIKDISDFNSHKIFTPDSRPVHTRMYRVFNGGWKRNGRLFVDMLSVDHPDMTENYQTIPKKERRRLSICGESTIELDYFACQPSLLYAKEGIEYTKDPYLEIVEDNVLLRKIAKKAIHICLFSQDKKTMRSAIQLLINTLPFKSKQILEDQKIITATDFINKISLVHKPISRYFGKDVSMKLCFVESEIILDVAVVLLKNEVNFMMVHDSIIIPKDYSDFTEKTMHEVYKNHVGVRTKIKKGNGV